eukprot:UN13461
MLLRSKVNIVNMRLQSLTVKCETKAKDNVFVHVETCVQYKVVDAEKSYYRLDRPTEQIEAYVFDVIRAEVPKLDLNDVFLEKESLSAAVKHNLADALSDFGFEISATPITDINPDR